MILANKRRFCLGVLAVVLTMGCWFLSDGSPAQAAVNDPLTFNTAEWNIIADNPRIGDSGGLQSMCATPNYIVCLQNRGSGELDSLIAYYRYDHDENNNPVEQYSQAFEVTAQDYEHGNGMTYNPNTNEILIATGSRLTNKENRGCIFVVDADTLTYKDKIKVTDEFNITGIDYSSYTNEYIMQSNYEWDAAYCIVDMDFNILDTIPRVTKIERCAYQDLYVSGDYLISIVSDMDTNKDNYIQLFSISRREYWGTFYLDIPGDESHKEAESLIEVEPGRFILGAITKEDNPIRLYETQLVPIFGVITSAVHGEISEKVMGLVAGDDYVVEFKPDKHYQLSTLTVNGQEVEIDKNAASYKLTDIQTDQFVNVKFKKLPKYKVTTEAENGSVSKSKSIYQGENGKIKFKPDEHYELSQILINGQPVKISGDETQYVLKDVQEAQTFKVVFKEIPRFDIKTSVVNGTLSGGKDNLYRDSSTVISYEPQEHYVLLAVLVDGKKVDKDQHLTEFEFQNIQESHTIQIIYVWKYMWHCIGAGFLVLVWGFWYVHLLNKRKKRRITNDKR